MVTIAMELEAFHPYYMHTIGCGYSVTHYKRASHGVLCQSVQNLLTYHTLHHKG